MTRPRSSPGRNWRCGRPSVSERPCYTRRRPPLAGRHTVLMGTIERRVARFGLCSVLVTAIGLPGSATESKISREAADRLLRKAIAINENALSSRPVSARTTVTEEELNSFLALDARDQLPVGVAEPRLEMLADGRVVARALVDLDAVRKQRSSGGWLDPSSYLHGQLPVSATGTLRASEGMARFDLESAEIYGIRIPKSLLQEVVAHYSRSSENPRGLDIDAPFPLPAGIRAIEVRKGQAIVLQ